MILNGDVMNYYELYHIINYFDITEKDITTLPDGTLAFVYHGITFSYIKGLNSSQGGYVTITLYEPSKLNDSFAKNALNTKREIRYPCVINTNKRCNLITALSLARHNSDSYVERDNKAINDRLFDNLYERIGENESIDKMVNFPIGNLAYDANIELLDQIYELLQTFDRLVNPYISHLWIEDPDLLYEGSTINLFKNDSFEFWFKFINGDLYSYYNENINDSKENKEETQNPQLSGTTVIENSNTEKSISLETKKAPIRELCSSITYFVPNTTNKYRLYHIINTDGFNRKDTIIFVEYNSQMKELYRFETVLDGNKISQKYVSGNEIVTTNVTEDNLIELKNILEKSVIEAKRFLMLFTNINVSGLFNS